MTVKLTDLRDDIDAIVLDLRRERNDGEVPIDDAIARVRSNLGDKISEAADQLIDLTLRKLIHDVSGRKRLSLALVGQTSLFGHYTGIPAMITTGRGKKRETPRKPLFRKRTIGCRHAKRKIPKFDRRTKNSSIWSRNCVRICEHLPILSRMLHAVSSKWKMSPREICLPGLPSCSIP